MEYIEATKEEIEKAKEDCKTLNCEECPLKESDYCIEQIKALEYTMSDSMYWQELTEEQKQEEYREYIHEVKTKHKEEFPMSYEDFCKEWEDCKTIRLCVKW